MTQIAMTAGLSVKTASLAVAALEVLGLAERSPEKLWHATSHGETCLFSLSAHGGPHEISREPSPNGRRLLELLERPVEGRSIAKRLGISRQRVKHVMRRLCAQGHVKFGDPEDPSWWVMRAEDETPLLTREEERVLSAIPGEYSTNILKIQRRTRLVEDRIETALDRLVNSGFVEAVGEFNGAALFRATAAGLEHPRSRPDIRDAEPPRLPVYSDRVRAVLSAIKDAGALRSKDVTALLRFPPKSTNALMQYLKRKGLTKKTGEYFDDPYALTVMGSFTLAEMAQPGQMKFGYPKGAGGTAGEFDGSAPRRTGPAGVLRRQRAQKTSGVKPPRLPVHSDRIQAVLSAISNADALRIKDVSDLLRLPPQSTNALMQYLKRKGLIKKTAKISAPPTP
jgi:Mn-dependent DtxR family transcriptional regulator